MHQYTDSFRPILAKWVYEVRMEHHFTQEDMAEHLRMSPRCYSNLELGKSGASLRTLVSIMQLIKESDWVPMVRELIEGNKWTENVSEITPPESRRGDRRGWR